jgi:hypothetical protein
MVEMRNSRCSFAQMSIFRPATAFLLNKLLRPGAPVEGQNLERSTFWHNVPCSFAKCG